MSPCSLTRSAWRVQVHVTCSGLSRLLNQPPQLAPSTPWLFLHCLSILFLIFHFFPSQGLAILQFFRDSGHLLTSASGHTSKACLNVSFIASSPTGCSTYWFMFPQWDFHWLYYYHSHLSSHEEECFSLQDPSLCFTHKWLLIIAQYNR